jgi:CPA2 family monovalent cation:H+ antiporter-2
VATHYSFAMASVVETAPLVLNVGVVLLAAASGGYVARKVGLPAIVGYLLVGVMVSPFTPGFVADNNQIAILADIGVVLLLFEVGIEINVKRIKREQGALLWAAPAQILIGLAITTPIFLYLGIPTLGALLLGLSVAMSSSVVIVNITRSRKRTTDSATEEALLGWSVMQDIVGVAIGAAILTFFSDTGESLILEVGGLIGFALLAIISGKTLPILLRAIHGQGDLLIIYSVAIGLTVAALGTVIFGIPMALASFVAGLAITHGEDTDGVRQAVLPFKDLFQVLFFVVIGSLIDVALVTEALPFTALLLGLLIIGKTLPSALLAKFGKMPARKGQLALGLSQVGEFSFVLGSAAFVAEAITKVQFTALLLTTVVSIVISTLAVRIRVKS